MRITIFASFVAICALVIMLYSDYLFSTEDVMAQTPCPFYAQGVCDSLEDIKFSK